jgi:ABC-2 type transport system permease protein
MTALARSELLKLRTLRSTALVLLGLLGIVAITVIASLAEAGDPGSRTPEELRSPVLIIGYITALFLVTLAANTCAGEYRHRTISQRFLVTPARGRVLAAKLATYSVMGAVVVTVLLGLTIAIEQPVLSGKDLSLALGDGELARMVGGAVIGTTLLAMLGVVVGMVSRNPTTAMLAIFGLLLAELLLKGVIGVVGKYLPFELLQSVLGVSEEMQWGLAALILGGITLASVVIAERIFLGRDVT